MNAIARHLALSAALCAALAGCTYDEVVRSETMTAAAGNAMAYNSALQIIDPEPLSSAGTRIALPAESYGNGSTAASQGGAGAGSGGTTTTGSY